MKTFKFKSICLLSQSEQRARRETFAPRLNLIAGENHTGKSSLIKSLFVALGARPEGRLENWDKNAIALVSFTIDGNLYHVLQQQSYRALYNTNGDCIFATGVSAEWGAEFSKLVGFNLVLIDKNQEIVSADARAFFLPFYLNQDGSWQAVWSTFANIQQFKAPVQPILDYFSGVKPPKYYEISALRDGVNITLKELRREHKLVSQVRERFGRTLPLSGPKTMPDVFEQDVTRLTDEVTTLNHQQEELRNTLVREQEVYDSLRLQIHMAQEALRTYDGDASFLRTEPHDTLVCPTCGAQHHKMFMDILNYAEDGRVLRELIIKLRNDSEKIHKEFVQTQVRLRELDVNYIRVSQVLEARRGDLKFDAVIKSMGAEVAFTAFEDELTELKSQIDRCLGEIDNFEAMLNELTSQRRSKEILKIFRDSYASARVKLNLPPVETKNLRLTSRPNLSGSGGPRSILAYYTAIWATTSGKYGSFIVPLVIDSPQQLGQDEKNLPKMIEYVAKFLPENSQVILGIEGSTEEKFDHIIELTSAYKLLQEDQYEQVNGIIQPFLDQMYARIFSEDSE